MVNYKKVLLIYAIFQPSIINVQNFGEGIRIASDNCKIINNSIKTNVDAGIHVLSSNNTIDSNNINSQSYAVYIDTITEIRYYDKAYFGWPVIRNIERIRLYNNSVTNNLINTADYSIYLLGNIYNTTIFNNNITTKSIVAIVENITDPFSNNIYDNIVNGVFLNYTGVIIADNNFNIYFDENGYFKYDTGNETLMLLLTELNNKNIIVDRQMNLLNNGLVNILNNVTLYVKSDNVLVKGFKFLNTDKFAVILDNVSNITLTDNEILINASINISAFDVDSSQNITVGNNTVYIKGIDSFVNALTFKNSTILNLTDNNIIVENNNITSAISLNSVNLTNITNNTLNIYGGYIANIISINNAENILFSDNNIIATSNQYISVLNTINSDNINLTANNFTVKSDHVESFDLVNTSDVTFDLNDINLINENLLDYTFRADLSSIMLKDNLIHTKSSKLATDNIEILNNRYVIDDNNIECYFNQDNMFDDGFFMDNDTILLGNLKLNHYNFTFNKQINIKSYDKDSIIDLTLIFNENSSNSTVSNLNFDLYENSAIIINEASNINIKNNSIIISNNISPNLSGIIITGKSHDNSVSNNTLIINGNNTLVGIRIYNYYDDYYGFSPENNQITNNTININSTDTSIAIYDAMTANTLIESNNITVSSNNQSYGVYIIYSSDYKVFMSTIWTTDTRITNNLIKGIAPVVCLINSIEAKNTLVENNTLITISNSSYGYIGNKSSNDIIRYNDFIINGNGNTISLMENQLQSGIYLTNSSSNILILENSIESNYILGGDYAIYAGEDTANIVIQNNYLVSDNWNRYSNSAIYAPSAILNNSDIYFVYVSKNGNDEGNGSINSPFKTIRYAIDNVINKGVIYVFEGIYAESDITINKTLNLVGLNNVIITGNGTIFNITKAGNLKISNISFTNLTGKNALAFNNQGTLYLSNITITNSTALDDGGCIINNANLVIENSSFSNNIAKNGGVILNYKNLNIDKSTFTNNSCYINGSGAVIYNIAGLVTVNNSYFNLNHVDAISTVEYDEYNMRLGSGSVIYNRNGELYVYNSNISDNYAFNQGAIISSGREVIVNNTYFYNNTCFNGEGGAVSVRNTKLTINNSYFIENSVGYHGGGGVFASNSEGIIYNTTFYMNYAYQGGAIDLWESVIPIIGCNISDNVAMDGGAIYYLGNRVADHVLGNLTIYNSTIANNKGLEHGGAFFVRDLNMNIKNSNIYNNFAGDRNNVLYVQNSIGNDLSANNIDLDGNWWGSDNGPGADVWLNANYFREWVRSRISWDSENPNIPENNNNGDTTHGSSTRPSQSTYLPINGPSTQSGLNSGTGTNSQGTGYGTGIGGGYSRGNGFGRVEGSGSSTGFATGGNSSGRSGSGEGFNGTTYSNQGSLGDSGSSASSGAGGSSGGVQSQSSSSKAYEINQDVSKNILSEDNIIQGIIFVLIVLLLIIIGYKRQSAKEDK